jgi:hypothetical protein
MRSVIKATRVDAKMARGRWYQTADGRAFELPEASERGAVDVIISVEYLSAPRNSSPVASS